MAPILRGVNSAECYERFAENHPFSQCYLSRVLRETVLRGTPRTPHLCVRYTSRWITHVVRVSCNKTEYKPVFIAVPQRGPAGASRLAWRLEATNPGMVHATPGSLASPLGALNSRELFREDPSTLFSDRRGLFLNQFTFQPRKDCDLSARYWRYCLCLDPGRA